MLYKVLTGVKILILFLEGIRDDQMGCSFGSGRLLLVVVLIGLPRRRRGRRRRPIR